MAGGVREMIQSAYRGHRWPEDHGCSNPRADGLTEYKLIVFGRQTSHHKAENMHESSNRNRKTWAILIEQSAGQGRHEQHEEN